ncbi:hypothetical protein GLYMA_11G219950v4 [Glycine max]|nr:hypothetical protein GLYMA_11G219950v4 [Glycine max]KAH1160272.1 hypothetical protein GYH30_031854 [Glycine max]
MLHIYSFFLINLFFLLKESLYNRQNLIPNKIYLQRFALEMTLIWLNSY